MVVGIGVGLASHVVPLYISECSTADKRGILITMNNVAITGGQLVAAITCGLFSNISQVITVFFEFIFALSIYECTFVYHFEGMEMDAGSSCCSIISSTPRISHDA